MLNIMSSGLKNFTNTLYSRLSKAGRTPGFPLSSNNHPEFIQAKLINLDYTPRLNVFVVLSTISLENSPFDIFCEYRGMIREKEWGGMWVPFLFTAS